MTQMQFEVPAQRFGKVLSHDMVLHNFEQERIQELVDSIGLGVTAVSGAVEVPDSNTDVPTVETFGQYL